MTAKIVGNLTRWEAAFYAMLTRARDLGEIRPDQELRALARFLTTSLQGLRVMSKVRPDREVLQDSVAVALSVLD